MNGDPRFRMFRDRDQRNNATPHTDQPIQGAGETAGVTEAPPGPMPFGARGRDPSGFPEAIPVGVPPAVAGAHRIEVPKNLRWPARPPLIQHFPSILAAAAGELINEGISFPAHSVRVDNWSNVFVLLDAADFYVLPWSVGWVIPMPRASTQLKLVGRAPSGFTQPALTAGGFVVVDCYEDDRPFSPGTSIPTGVHP